MTGSQVQRLKDRVFMKKVGRVETEGSNNLFFRARADDELYLSLSLSRRTGWLFNACLSLLLLLLLLQFDT